MAVGQFQRSLNDGKLHTGTKASLARRKREAALAATQFVRTRLSRRLDRMLEFGIASLLYAWAIKETIGSTQIVSFGFYTFHIIDIPIAIIALYCAFSLKYIKIVRPRFLLIFLIPTAILFINSLLGLINNVPRALLDARYWYALAFTPLAAILCQEPARLLNRCHRYAVHAGIIMSALVYLRLMTTPNLFFIEHVAASEVNDGGRGLASQGATSVLIAFWLTFLRPAPVKMRHKLRTIALRAFLLSGVVLSLQGTTLIAAALTLIVFAGVSYRPLRLASVVTLPIFALVAPLILPTLLNLIFGAEFVSHRLDNEVTRKLVWAAFMRQYEAQSFIIKMIGWPFGAMPTLNIHYRGVSSVWAGGAHSMYIGGLKNMGLLGNTVLLIAMSIMLLRFINIFFKYNFQSYLIMSFIIVTLFLSFYSYEATAPIAGAMLWPILAARILPRYKKNLQAAQN